MFINIINNIIVDFSIKKVIKSRNKKKKNIKIEEINIKSKIA